MRVARSKRPAEPRIECVNGGARVDWADSVRADVEVDVHRVRERPGEAAEPVRAAAGTQIKHHAIAARVERARADKRREALGELAQERAARAERRIEPRIATEKRRPHVIEWPDRRGLNRVKLENLQEIQ